MHTDTISHPINDAKTIRAWAFFDWANSAYSLVITTAIFPIYFVAVAPDTVLIFGERISNTALYSYSISFAYLLIALVAPLLGGIADYSSRRLQFLKIFTTLGAVACVGLYFFSDSNMVWFATVAFIISTIGYAGSLIFYDAFLPVIASEDQYDRVSAQGYAYGYIGSVLLLLFILFMSQKPELFGFASDSSIPYRLGFVLVGLWWLGFGYYSFARLPKDEKNTDATQLLSHGFKELQGVIGEVRTQKNLTGFLVSFFFYSAGVQTVIYLATVFAEKELAFDSSELIVTVLILQIVAIGGAYLFARVSKILGSKKALLIMIGIWCGICLAAYFVHTKIWFYAIAFFVGMVLGGIQSSSRASYSKLLPDGEDDLNSYFSLYDMLYYCSLVFGTFSFGLIEQLTGSLRYSVLSLVSFFVIAIFFLSRVTIEED